MYVVMHILLTMPSVTPKALGDSDEVTVAKLDTEYQAAVQKNDVATMDRILADDFALVAGKGRTFTKIDLLNEARARNVNYEHQEDSNQKVRIWVFCGCHRPVVGQGH